MAVHASRLKIIEFKIGDTDYAGQLRSWTLDPGTDDGDRQWTFDGSSFVEDTDNEPTLELTFFADWRSEGISAFLWENQGETAQFTLDHHPDKPEEHVRWTGSVQLKAAPAGGDARTTEETEVTLPIIGDPVFERVADEGGEGQ